MQTVVRTFAEAFVQPFIEPTRGRRVLLLIMREYMHPRLPQGTIVRQMIGPIRRKMIETLQQVEPGLDEARADIAVHCIVGQLVHLIMMLHGPNDQPVMHDSPTLNDLSEALPAIVRFSTAGVRGLLNHQKLETSMEVT